MPLEKMHILTRMDSVSARFLVNALDKADPRGLHHAFCVAEVSHALGTVLEHERFTPEEFWLAGLLHDIGLLGIPKKITDKRGKLTKVQKEYIKHHTKLSKFMVDNLFTAPEISQAVLCHHERTDGNGYPNGISGEDIPFMSRVVAIADSYDAMRSAAWLLKKRSHDNAVAELGDCAGTQFDPEIVKHFHLHHDPIYVAYEKAKSLSIKDVMRRI